MLMDGCRWVSYGFEGSKGSLIFEADLEWRVFFFVFFFDYINFMFVYGVFHTSLSLCFLARRWFGITEMVLSGLLNLS